MTNEEAIKILCTCEKKPDWKHTSGMIEEACRIISSLETPPNDPLTLEELRKMIGEPLWVVPLGKEPDWKPCWVICMEDYILVHSTTSESRVYILRRNEDYGKTWLAYRYKPSE